MPKKKITEEVERLKKLGFLIVNKHKELQVTAWANDGLCYAMKNNNFSACLQKLKEKGIYHCDMKTYKVI